MNGILEYVKMRFDVYMLWLMVGIGAFLAFVDAQNLKKKKLKKDETIARNVGLFYIIFAFAMYIIKSVWLR